MISTSACFEIFRWRRAAGAELRLRFNAIFPHVQRPSVDSVLSPLAAVLAARAAVITKRRASSPSLIFRPAAMIDLPVREPAGSRRGCHPGVADGSSATLRGRAAQAAAADSGERCAAAPLLRARRPRAWARLAEEEVRAAHGRQRYLPASSARTAALCRGGGGLPYGSACWGRAGTDDAEGDGGCARERFTSAVCKSRGP